MATSTHTNDPLDALTFDATTGKRATYEDIHMTPGAGVVHVRNESHADGDEHTYDVHLDAEGVPVACDCPDFEYRKGPKGEACKHQTRVAESPAVIDAALPEGGR